MFELARHIEILLLDSDCVIIPDFGGFVAYNSPAKLDEEEAVFLPPTRVIGFNPHLRMNDGLLVQSYMKVYDTNFSDASKILDAHIVDLIEKLHEEGKVEFDNIGELLYSVQGSYTFVPYDNKTASPLLFGLDTFEIKELRSLLRPGVEKKIALSVPEVRKINGNSGTGPVIWRNIAGTAVVGTVAVFLFFMSAPVENTYVETGNYARIFPSEMTALLGKNSLLTTRVNIGDMPAEPSPDAILKVPREVIDGSNDSEKVSDTPARSFYLIAASVILNGEAERIVERLKSQGYPEAKIIKGNGKLRVSVMSFSTREEANKQLYKLRQNPVFQDCWLLVK